MPPRSLKLGTRRSALARAQSALIAQQLQRSHDGLTVELVGLDTRGDRIQDRPLTSVEGKEFFTAELDAALLAGAVDLTVHSYKDLSLQRPARLRLAAVPPRELPHDIAIFARDVPQRLAAGHELLIGTSSPRRASFVPELLQRVLPRAQPNGASARVRLVELRGNVDSRLRRLHEPRASARQLDGIVLAIAGLARLWADASGRALLEALFAPLPRMVLPLSACPTAPAQGALAIECRADDAATAQWLAPLDHAGTRRAVQAERALLAERGGGCHQRFGATMIEVPHLGTLLYLREAEAAATSGQSAVGQPQLLWTPERALDAPGDAVLAWDGSRLAHGAIEALEAGNALSLQRLPLTRALFVAHRRALTSGAAERINPAAHIWVPGLDSWQGLAEQGLWVEGCADGLGFAALEPLLSAPLLQLPPLSQWTILTHAAAAGGWAEGEVIATYTHGNAPAEQGAPPPAATHLYWHSSAQFDRWHGRTAVQAQHACGPGKTYQHLMRAGVQNLRMFPSAAQWREWLRL
ncbi:MAG: hydroxymethylbilane synthase [Steroidobacteraceae bacterium]|jgi:hydroxymethylbilane synthase